jgi:hypothetical protein
MEKDMNNKWILYLGVVFFINLTNSVTLYTMEKSKDSIAMTAEEKKELCFYLKEVFPPEIVQKIQNFMASEVIEFLTMMPTKTFKIDSRMYGANEFALNDDKIVIGTKFGSICMWNMHTGKLLHTLQQGKAENDKPYSIVMQNNEVAISFEMQEGERVTKIWDIDTGVLLSTIGPDIAYIENQSDNHDDRQLILKPNVLKVCDTKPTFKVIREINVKTVLRPDYRRLFGGALTKLSGDDVVAVFGSVIRIWPIDPFKGTSENNPFIWILRHADFLQILLIKQIFERNMESKEFAIRDFVIPCLSENGKIFLEFPEHVRQYLLSRLYIYLRR